MNEGRLEQLATEVAELREKNEALARKLERSGRGWRLLGGLGAAVCAVALFTGQDGGKTVEADTFLGKSYDVKGKGDKLRASFGVSEKGTFPQLVLMDNKERIRLQIGLDKEGEGLITFFDKDGKAGKQISDESK